MSDILRGWALDAAPTSDGEEKLVLAKLAKHADTDGRGTWPSVPNIAEGTHLSEETVRRRLKALLTRGVIARGDQSLVRHYRADQRPTVYDLLVPYAWYSPGQLAEAQASVGRFNAGITNRATKPRELLTPENRPTLAPAPPKRRRADTGVKNPKRSGKQRASSTTTRLQDTPRPDELSQRGADGLSTRVADGVSTRGADGVSTRPATTPLQDHQNSHSEVGPLEISQTDRAAGRTPDWLTDDVAPNEPRQDGGADSSGAQLLRRLRLTRPGTTRALPLSEPFVRQHERAVTALLGTWPAAELLELWQTECAGPRLTNPVGLLVTLIGSTRPYVVPGPAASPAPTRDAVELPWCGRDGSDGEDPCDPAIRQRRDADGAYYPCDECSPGTAAEQHRRDASHGASPPPRSWATPPTAGAPAGAASVLDELGLVPG